MKKFINKVDDIVPEMLEGLTLAFPEILKRLPDYEVVVRSEFDENKVSLISGGGSGHEPAHAGYVGKGMLDAAIAGPVFTSPTPDQILAAIQNVPNKNGVLLIVKNYTGDVMNFEMAAQMAATEDIKVETVIVDEDIALNDLSSVGAGKRGLAGTIFVHKISGAKAMSGASLAEVKATAQKVVANVATFGIGLNGATVPANHKRGFELSDGIAEVGLGIHGEPGLRQEPMKTADEFTAMIMEKIIDSLKLTANSKVGLLINGLGATPEMELDIIARKAIMMLKDLEVEVVKTWVGNYLTSIDMPGMSISVVKLDDETQPLLLAGANTIGMKVF
ncbi:PTS-dependent dihydroxyacetone kinase, dihydroxyacetone-binding subunit DhaK [Mesoplasma sp. JKS002658]|uniref:dihydroxyacetone kinase subunit DhaK n=1 Tax=Mesoplasma whartonense TaxID=2878854 RepID=UPI002022AEF2|nr:MULTISPECIES: dihydroxyacetone kinase subunit DhaK [unclassified Mesoplasma]MCL8211220.1 PTS-dependent dihydroxyacetone kinase, dihydroxyacetone-binding subunit DhaK [Mesoplasma sp. JKS002664]MCL8211881.1 PTS-dependent dihydroxyacetone kinase, dihydroxyacetone-binding subunit DhaK [Mesoplasma sp. JKS002662]MCL8212888.1 PTS-dependent dihydroxyacetone kinase, dihydroxyacetone-binding subunit DhaK [Mesoplasma sp. JKS002661]MCL8214014.1 PTS-dependent dihydroxyacetone kinase, dihydroxyacetone-bin